MHSRKRRTIRRVVATPILATLLFASCDIPFQGYVNTYHEKVVAHASCTGTELRHMRAYPYPAHVRWWSVTDGMTSAGCSGVAARLLYRWTDGNFYLNAWVWGSEYARSTNDGAVSSPESQHIVCSSSSSCRNFTN